VAGQIGVARAACALARSTRRDRPLGAAQARDRWLADRRLGTACEDRGRYARRQRPARGRADLAQRAPALRRTVRLAGRARPQASGRRCRSLPARAHAIDDSDLAAFDPKDFLGEWKWDGIRVQAVAGTGEDGRMIARLYSRTGEDISGSFSDLIEALRLPGAIDGELLIMRAGRVQSFNVLQQRLNRKTVNVKLLAEF